MTTYAGSAADPVEYGKLIAARLCPNTLPYELGTSAAFEVASFNGRALSPSLSPLPHTTRAALTGLRKRGYAVGRRGKLPEA